MTINCCIFSSVKGCCWHTAPSSWSSGIWRSDATITKPSIGHDPEPVPSMQPFQYYSELRARRLRGSCPYVLSKTWEEGRRYESDRQGYVRWVHKDKSKFLKLRRTSHIHRFYRHCRRIATNCFRYPNWLTSLKTNSMFPYTNGTSVQL